ncbi:MAG: hypothetical protein JST36_06530 [Bacteroidetes bacterium]|nr:hypothetical protein [Bacteroidota bacterium]
MMFRICCLLFLLPLALPVQGQQFHGKVYDEDRNIPLASVLVTNLHSNAMWVSDKDGNIAFTALPGELLRFHLPGYHDYDLRIFSDKDLIKVGMVRAPIELAEVEVLSPMARYRRDSTFNRQFFHKELGYAGRQTKMNYSGGIGIDGPFSALALWASGKKKYYKNFQKELVALEDMRYASIRYTPELVKAQTGLDDSGANAFIRAHPIPNDFVRYASELELKMWVRNEYRAAGKKE